MSTEPKPNIRFGTPDIEFFVNIIPDYAYGNMCIVLGKIFIKKNLSYKEFDEQVTSLLRQLVPSMSETDEGLRYIGEGDYHVGTVVGKLGDIVGEVVVFGADRIVDDLNGTYVFAGECFEVGIVLHEEEGQ